MIDVRGLRKVFPNGHVALEEVSLSVADGELVCVIGRSGAGKSTLLRCLNGAIEVTAGTVSVDGVEVSRASAEERRRLRRRIGFIYQELNLVERLSVLRNVLVGRLGRAGTLTSCLGLFPRADRELALFNVDRVHLLDRAGQRADTLSGGDAGAVSSTQHKRMIETGIVDEANLVTLITSDPIPSSPFAARASLDAGLAENLKQAFLEAHNYMAVEIRKELLGGETNRYVAADDTLYDPIRETARILNLDLTQIRG